MSHGDDSGLQLPPRVAPVQIVIVPISIGNWKENVLPQAREIEAQLKREGLRVKMDDREEFTPGWKFSDWEMRGVPLRIEIGPRDIEENQAVAVRRDTREKESIGLEALAQRVPEILKNIQTSMLEAGLKFQLENTHEVTSYEDFKSTLESKRGFIKAYWCGHQSCEEKIKEETMATVRVVPLEQDKKKTREKCFCCGKDSEVWVYFARAY